MKRVAIAFIASATLAGPLLAQQDGRQALASEVVDDLLPDGFYRRMMDGTMDQMMDQVLAQMMNMTPDQMGIDTSNMTEEERAALEGRSMRELAEMADPHFAERMDITMDVMMGEMVDMMSDIEPVVKDALAASFARRFEIAELRELSGFFDTPTGAKFASGYMDSFTDPEMMQAMQSFVPQLMQAMPGIMEKVRAATEHLPVPVKTEPAN